jgi:hypothetical protein
MPSRPVLPGAHRTSSTATNETPYLNSSTVLVLTHVLNDTASHDFVMNALPESLQGTA